MEHKTHKTKQPISEIINNMDPYEPILCVIGGTGCGKSTFCHCIIGEDPRINQQIFYSTNSAKSVTKDIEIVTGLRWFDANESSD